MVAISRCNFAVAATTLVTLIIGCAAETTGSVTAPPTDCQRYYPRFNPPVATFPPDNNEAVGYRSFYLNTSPPLPDWLRNNAFEVQQRAHSNFYFAAYKVNGDSFDTNWVITFRRPDNTYISSWILKSGFRSCNLDSADAGLYEGFENFVLSRV